MVELEFLDSHKKLVFIHICIRISDIFALRYDEDEDDDDDDDMCIVYRPLMEVWLSLHLCFHGLFLLQREQSYARLNVCVRWCVFVYMLQTKRSSSR